MTDRSVGGYGEQFEQFFEGVERQRLFVLRYKVQWRRNLCLFGPRFMEAVVTEKFKALLAEYGRLAMITYFAIFALVLASFYLAIASGFHPASGTESIGTLGAAWLATKLTQPLRIGVTLLLTPVIGMALKRIRGRAEDKLGASQD